MPHPCDGFGGLPKQNRKENHHELCRIPNCRGLYSEAEDVHPRYRRSCAFEFLILTAARTDEVLNATWEEIDLKNRMWIVPASQRMKMKTATQGATFRTLYRNPELAKQFNDAELFFLAAMPDAHFLNGVSHGTAAMGHDALTAHGFRATFKTWAEEKTKFDSLVIEAYGTCRERHRAALSKNYVP